MRTPSALLAALLLTSSLNPSLAVAKGNATLAAIPYVSVPQPCPFGTSGLANNGCSTSTPGQPGSTGVRFNTGRAPGDILNQLTTSPTNYFVNGPPRNVSCVDYTCGSYLPLSSMGNPVTALPALFTGGAAGTCVYASTGSGSGGPKMTCTPSTGAMNIGDYDWTVGGTTCVPLVISGNAIGVVTVSDNNWKSNGQCTVSTNFPAMLQITGRTTGRTVITKNTLDSNVLNFPYSYGACAPGSGLTINPACNPTEAYIASGDLQVDHNLFAGFSQRPIQYSAQDASVGQNYEYNGLIGCCSDNVAAHNEFEEYIVAAPGNAGAKNRFHGSTFIATTLHHTNGDAAFPGDLSNSLNVKPIFEISDNFYLTGTAGGASASNVTVAGSITGNTFTTSSISGGTFGTGQLLSCGTSPFTVGAFGVFPGSTLTTPAGPGGGGWTSTVGATFPLTWGGTIIAATLDNGSGSAGNTLTVTNDSTLILTVGSTIAFGGAIGTRTIQALTGTGTGTTGTYPVNGAAALQATPVNITASPVNIYPGGWSVPGTVTCTAQTIQNGAAPWSIPFVDVVGNYGQVTNVGNYVDMWPYNGGVAGGSQSSNRTSAFGNFNGTIVGTTLTVNSGTSPTINQGILDLTGVASGTYIVSGTSPTFTVSISQNIGPVAMQSTTTICGSPTIWGSSVGDPNVDMSGLWTAVMNTYGAAGNPVTGTTSVQGNNCGP